MVPDSGGQDRTVRRPRQAPLGRLCRWALSSLLFLLVAVPLSVAFGLYLFLSDVAVPRLSLTGERAVLLPDWKGKERVNILLLGSDARPGEAAPPRTDTIIFVTIDPAGKSAGLLSIPRDLWVTIPGYGQERVNAAFALGESRQPGAGPELAKRTVSQLLGQPVHYYALVGLQGFERIINQLGGIIVDVERPLKDDEYPSENYSVRRIYIHPGVQRMDGETALWYVRSRHQDSDFGRARRQQQVLFALRQQGLRLRLLPNVPALLQTLSGTVKTDLQPAEILALARLGSELDPARIVSRVIDESMTQQWFTPAGADVQLPRQEAIARVVREVLGAAGTEGQAEAAARIEVQNGTTIDGLAQRTANWLRGRGLTVVRVTQAPAPAAATVLIDYSGMEAARRRLAEELGLTPAQVRVEHLPPAQRPDVDLRVVLGPDFRPPQATAQRPDLARQ